MIGLAASIIIQVLLFCCFQPPPPSRSFQPPPPSPRSRCMWIEEISKATSPDFTLNRQSPSTIQACRLFHMFINLKLFILAITSIIAITVFWLESLLSRKDVEGSLFVVKRNTQPRFQFVVMNRRNTENLVENLLRDFQFELQVPYLLYRNATQEVNGIWFYNKRECQDVANLFTRILGAYSKAPSKLKVNKSDFEELEAVPTSAVIEGPLEPGLTTNRIPEDYSFVNFFSNAMNLGANNNNTPTPVNSVQPYHNSTTIPLSSRDVPSPAVNNPPLQIPSSATPMPQHDSVDHVNSTNHLTNLIKPLPFFTPSSSSTPLVRQSSTPVPVSALQPPLNAQRNVGVPLLQPFPPPTPPPSLTPTAVSGSYHGPLTREKVRDVFVILSQMKTPNSTHLTQGVKTK